MLYGLSDAMNPLISSLGWISFFLAMASYCCGAFAIIRGPAHPSIISRFFWLALSITNFLSYWEIMKVYNFKKALCSWFSNNIDANFLSSMLLVLETKLWS